MPIGIIGSLLNDPSRGHNRRRIQASLAVEPLASVNVGFGLLHRVRATA